MKPLFNIGKLLLATLCCLFQFSALAAPHETDPRAIRRWEGGWRYPQAGWTVVHIEGAAYERGLQHGHLLAPEIVDYLEALAQFWGPDAPRQAWEHRRTLANALFLRGFTSEQLLEMKGIAAGAAAEGARLFGRPLDLVDIVALNSANEIDTLDDALQATPTGLEGLAIETGAHRPVLPAHQLRQRPLRCSAFAAIGPATRDGKLVFGHVTMYDLYPANFYNVWIEVKPQHGLRFVMQTTPGGMHSGMDYSINDAGLLLSETTLEQTRFAPTGHSLASRIREAQQYADSIERAAEILGHNGNGLTTTEWLLADIKRNEIALLTLGTRQSVLRRSSRQEWVAGAEGFYWSDNNIKDMAVRLETVAALDGQPSPVAANAPSKRDAIWLQAYDTHKGRIDLDFARRLLTTPEMVSSYAVDAKYTNAEMAARLSTWASFGPPVGAIWKPSNGEQKKYPAIKPLIHNPWTVLGHPVSPRSEPLEAADRRKPGQANPEQLPVKPVDEPVWRGTLLPAGDADIWLSTAFANYERLVALERRLQREASQAKPATESHDELGVELAYYRSLYALGARAGHDFALSETRASLRDEHWFQLASAKGVLLLHSLRGVVGADRFDRAMDDFGRQHAGRPVDSQSFQRFMAERTGTELHPFFDWWLGRTGLPRLAVSSAKVARSGAGWNTTVELDVSALGPALAVPVTVETEDGEVTVQEVVGKRQHRITIRTPQRPLHVIVDKYGLTARANGSPYTILSFDNELERTLIVYGTLDEAVGNQEAAQLLQHALRRREHNVLPKVRSDQEVTEDELRSHHLVLVGRPSTNALTARWANRLPVDFGRNSFKVRGELYTHEESAVIVADENPLNPRYASVVMAGLSSLGTYRIAPRFEEEQLAYVPLVVLPNGQESEEWVPALPELSIDLK